MRNYLAMCATAVMLSGCGGSGNSGSGRGGEDASNQAPVVQNLQLSHPNPDTIKLGDQLVLSYQYKDAEDDVEDGSAIQWFLNDTLMAGESSASLSIAGNYYGKKITATVTPRAASGTEEGKPVSVSFDIHADTAPEITNPVIIDRNGGNVHVGDTLEIAFSFNDREDHPQQNIMAYWYSDERQVLAGNVQEYTVKPSDLKKRISVRFKVLANSLWSPEVESTESIQVIPELEFTKTGSAVGFIGQPYSNPVKDPDGVVYSSDDTAIAEVDSQGVVTLKREGRVTISANDGFSLAQYDLRALSRTQPLYAGLGQANGSVTVYGDKSDMILHSSASVDCDIQNPANCEQLKSTELQNYQDGSVSIGDLNVARGKTASLSLEFANYVAKTEMNAIRPESIYGAAVGYFKGRLWSWGGYVAGQPSQRIWSSIDGINWQEHTSDSSALFSHRYHHQIAELNGQLYLLGGEYNGSPFSDVWRSADGIEWQKISNATTIGNITRHSMESLDGKLWLLGGSTRSRFYSTDGINWTNDGFGSAVSSTRLSVFIDADGHKQLVKIENNAASRLMSGSWELINDSSAIYNTNSVQGVLHNGILHLFDMANGQGLEVAKDGQNQAFEHDFPFNAQVRFISAPDALYALPYGTNSAATLYRSEDARHWQRLNSSGFQSRSFAAATRHNGEYVVAGGRGERYLLNDVWSSEDGVRWQQRSPSEATAGIPDQGASSDPTLRFSLASFNGDLYFKSPKGLHRKAADSWDWQAVGIPALLRNDKIVSDGTYLWYLGNNPPAGSSALQVFRMDKQGNWQSMAGGSVPNLTSNGFSIAASSGYLYVTGGGNGQLVWRSGNGQDWTQISSLPEPRTGATLIDYQDELLLIGGYNPASGVYQDDALLLTAQGQWSRTAFPGLGREGAYAVAQEETLFTGGGSRRNQLQDDLWQSYNGENWLQRVMARGYFKAKSPR